MLPSPMLKPFQTTLRATIHRSDGTTVSFQEVPANSLIVAFIKMLKVQMSSLSETIVDVANSNQLVLQNNLILQAAAAAADTTYGIVIGTGTTDVAMNDYKLVTKVTTNIAHGAMTFNLNAPDASTYQLLLARTFANNTGSSLGIKEVGLYVIGYTGVQKIFCVERTLYSVDVANGLSVTLTYALTVIL
jgi:uncharacterized ubiquitin-like protein YukD